MRPAGTREPRFDIDFQDGYNGELFAENAVRAIKTGGSIEIKNDLLCADTGNVYIEFECLQNAQWRPSGIDARSTRSVVWCHIVNTEFVIFASTKHVRHIALTKGQDKQCIRGSHPTKGKVIPLTVLTRELARLGQRWQRIDNGMNQETIS